jgi:hypothetical protein
VPSRLANLTHGNRVQAAIVPPDIVVDVDGAICAGVIWTGVICRVVNSTLVISTLVISTEDRP